MSAYYNENNLVVADILRHMIKIGVIADGVVDDRSIKDVQASDVKGFDQCHFFAGGGFWSIACRMAGWHDDRPIWTASCPCQPWSGAGKQAGFDDPRHLWPDLYRIIGSARKAGFGPTCIVGEQVTGKAGRLWFDRVRVDLDGEGIKSRCVDFPACAVNAPHRRQRQYWLALANPFELGWEMARYRERVSPTGGGSPVDIGPRPNAHDVENAALHGWSVGTGPVRIDDTTSTGFLFDGPDEFHGGMADRESERGRSGYQSENGRIVADLFGPMGDAERSGWEGLGEYGDQFPGSSASSGRSVTAADDSGMVDASIIGRRQGFAESGILGRRDAIASADLFSVMADAGCEGRQDATRPDLYRQASGERSRHGEFERSVSAHGNYWSDAEWIECHDGKARRTKPGIRFLVDGLPGRVDLWGVAGNAIVPQAAAEVIGALKDILDGI